MDWKSENGIDYLNTKDSKFVTKEDFEKFFGKANSYEELINHEKATDGWKLIFNDWKAKGIFD